ncbi:hypothetical protein CRUP_038085, partial [Coryphaenoides rupestris]
MNVSHQPELTVSLLPSYLALGRPLLLLFLGGGEEEEEEEQEEQEAWGRREARAALEEVRATAAAAGAQRGGEGAGGGAQPYLPCWIHLLADHRWGPPAAPFYDFLAAMDHEAPEFARPSAPRAKTGETGGGRGEEGAWGGLLLLRSTLS